MMTHTTKTISVNDTSLNDLLILSKMDNKYITKSLSKLHRDTITNSISFKIQNLKHLTNFDTMSNKHVRDLISGCIYGLNCLHNKGFLHLDIKPSTIMYEIKNNTCVPTLTDFGLSVRVDDSKKGVELKKIRGDHKYVPYELLTQENNTHYLYNEKSDIWSLGFTILHCFNFEKSSLLDDYSIPHYKSMCQNALTDLKPNLTTRYNLHSSVNETVINSFLTSAQSDFQKINPDITKKNIHDFIELNELHSLISSMLKITPKQRISSECLIKMPYIKEDLKSICTFKHESNYIIPYIDYELFSYCMTKIEDFFDKSKYKVEVLFMSIEIIIQILSLLTKKCSDEQTVFCKNVPKENYVEFAINYSLNYYGVEKNNKVLNYLSSIHIIGCNTNFNHCAYLEDLLYIYDQITKNYNLFSIFNVLNIKEVLLHFRSSFEYQNKSKNVLCDEFFKELSQIRKQKLEQEFPYSIKSTVDKSSVIGDKEYKFRQQIYKSIESHIIDLFREHNDDYIDRIKNKLYTNTLNRFIFENLDKVDAMISSLNSSLFKKPKLKIQRFDKNTILDLDTHTIIFNLEKQDISYIYFSDNNCYHYYCKNNDIESYCKEQSLNYKVKTKSIICKSDLCCIIYSIYNAEPSPDTNIILTDNTIILMLLHLFITK